MLVSFLDDITPARGGRMGERRAGQMGAEDGAFRDVTFCHHRISDFLRSVGFGRISRASPAEIWESVRETERRPRGSGMMRRAQNAFAGTPDESSAEAATFHSFCLQSYA